MPQEIETARFLTVSELPPDLDDQPWVNITQTYLSPFPADESFPEIAHGELRLRHMVNHLGKKSCVATVKFGDKRDGQRLEVETELTKGDFARDPNDFAKSLTERLAHSIIKKRRYMMGDNRTIDIFDPEFHDNLIIEEQEYPESQGHQLANPSIPRNHELAAPVANTSPRLEPPSQEEIIAAIERRYRRNGKLLISVSGMSGSGKTTFAEKLADDTGATLVKADDFHIGSRTMKYYGYDLRNHDHPKVYDYFAAGDAAYKVMEGQDVVIPKYDFATAERSSEPQHIPGNDKGLVIVEGLYGKKAGGFANTFGNTFNILIDRPEYVCILRRLLRDSAPELTGLGVGRSGIFSTPASSLKYIVETAVPTYLRHQAPLQGFDAIA